MKLGFSFLKRMAERYSIGKFQGKDDFENKTTQQVGDKDKKDMIFKILS